MSGSVVDTARAFLEQRTSSLLKDVRHCILEESRTPHWPAPFPAVLYCFSTLDLLGALYGGDASSHAKTTDLARNYIVDVMQYDQLHAELLQKQFRHKLVHLAEPKPSVKSGQTTYHWQLHHADRAGHRVVTPIGPAEAVFSISILSLAEDIALSVEQPGGYIDRLSQQASLQSNFTKAHTEIKR